MDDHERRLAEALATVLVADMKKHPNQPPLKTETAVPMYTAGDITDPNFERVPCEPSHEQVDKLVADVYHERDQQAGQTELHRDCHDLVCSGDRSQPRGAKGSSCSCSGRDTVRAELDALKDAILPSWREKSWADLHSLVLLAEAHREDSQDVDASCESDNYGVTAFPDRVGGQLRLRIKELEARQGSRVFRHMRDGVMLPCTLAELLDDADRFACRSDTASWYVGALAEAIRTLVGSHGNQLVSEASGLATSEAPEKHTR